MEKNSEALTIEFLYDHDTYLPDDSNEYRLFTSKHRIVKRTPKRIFIERHPWREGRSTDVNSARFYGETISLDRAALERDGKVWCKSHRSTFYLSPEHPRLSRGIAESRVPSCFAVLGLYSVVGLNDIKTAYRTRSKALHPDQGGNHDEFIRLQQAYEQALAYASKAM